MPEGRSLLSAIHRHALEQPDRRALVFLDADGQEERVATFADVLADARRAAWTWRQQGVDSADVVLLALDHGYDLVAGFLGALYAGAVPVILPYPRPHRVDVDHQRLLSMAEHTRARAVFTTEPIAEWTDRQGKLAALGCRLRGFALAQVGAPPDEYAPEQRANDALLYLQLTSGTTGVPKLAALSQRAVIAQLEQYGDHACETNDVIVSWMPFHHDMGLITSLLMPLVRGLLSVTLSPARWIIRPESIFAAIHNYRGTLTYLPNFALGYSVQRIPRPQAGRYDLSCVRLCEVAAELVSHASLEGFARHFAGWGIQDHMLQSGWGMSEQVFGVTAARPGKPSRVDWISQKAISAMGRAQPIPSADPDARSVVCVGAPISGVEMRVTDSQHRSLPERHVGDVLVRTPFCFEGYYNSPELTAEVLQDGWYRTGDVGYLAEGEFFVLGRKDDLIIVGGQNIQPQTLEEMAAAVLGPRGRLAVAFGVRDERLGTQIPVLICETRDLEPDGLLAEWKAEIQRLAHEGLNVALADIQFVPKGWVIQSDAKVGRAANREKYLAERQPPRPVLAGDDLMGSLAGLAAEMIGVATVQPEENFFEMGGDSLTAMRFVVAVEEAYGREVPAEFFREPTVAHLVDLFTREGEGALSSNQPSAPPETFAPAQPRHPQQSWTAGIRRIPRATRGFLRRRIQAAAYRRPYFEAVQWLMRWYGRRWFQVLLYPEESQLVRRFAKSMGTPEAMLESEVRLSLVSHLLAGMADEPETDSGDRHLEGPTATHLQDSLQGGRGVILALLHPSTRFAFRRYVRQCSEIVTTVGDVQYAEALTELGADADRRSAQEWSAARSLVATRARQTLTRGGIALIAGDGNDRIRGQNVEIGDRIHNLRTGFAELAVLTGARILPCYQQRLPTGILRFVILPPLVWDESRSRAAQVEQIVSRYGEVLADIWKHAPSVVIRPLMRQHLSFPSALGPSPVFERPAVSGS